MALTDVLDARFELTAHGTTVRTEALAGATTFLTMAYIIFVQPAVLSAAGMDFGAVLTATCLSTAFATALMAWLANYPIAVAPAMGHNFFFAYSVVIGMQVPWRVALGAVAIAGIVFVLTAGIGLRERLITAIPAAIKHAMAAGIGLLIAMVGLQWAGLIVAAPGTLVTLGNLHSPPVLLAVGALTLTAILMARRVPGAMLWGILASAAVGWALGLVQYQGIAGRPPSLLPTLLQLDVAGALAPGMAAIVLVFFFLALFDSVGTLVAIGGQAGLMRDGTLPRARQALLADAIGTVAGAVLGTSTVTAYVESSAGVAVGGRTGLASLVTAALFLLSLLFYPIVRMIGGGYQTGGSTLYPVIAAPLVLVGTLMMGSLRHVAWEDPTESVPAFLTLIMMPLTVSITEGIAFGVLAYAVMKLASGRGREVHPLMYVFALLFLLRYMFLR
ncbi:MAG: guanine permease [Acidobacteria bacterium RIFCSPLOWO2_12_FULL_65_11]|nr:MAG: guanine permease [Acidobacteria bacterium RIFCSPLOWO2_02_FULL_64_15]OFW30603.1 MAG: guanine permease [Acidobacteria bacterium RIFCSPLOWO2_12_FULL_65_11]